MVRNNIERIRISKGVTKTHLGKMLGLTIQGYRHLMSGTSLDVDRVAVIAQALGVQPGVFYDDELTDSVIKGIENIKIATIKKTGTG